MYASSAEQRRSERVRVLAEQLYRERYHYLLRIATKNAATPEDAAEAVQFAFLMFIEKFHPESGSPPLAWLTLVAKREAWAKRKGEHLDRRVGQEAAPDSDEPGFSVAEIPSEATGTEEMIERAESTVDARERLAALKPAERRALVLIAAGFSYQEVGEMNAWSYTKVNRSAAEGRAALRKAAAG